VNQFEITTSMLKAPRMLWVQPPIAGRASDCLVFLDAELYRDRIQAPKIIRDLQSADGITSTTCVYVSSLSPADRHVDYTCNEMYSLFLATDLLRWIESTVDNHKRYFLCGLSLSGLSAAYTALRHPAIFSGAVCQSPSAWWNDEWLGASLEPDRPRHGRFWISVGNQELQQGVAHPPTGLVQKVNQRDACRRLAERLIDFCNDLHYSEYSGGHDPQCWAEELSTALEWVLKR
jgi:enterochelin esterase family protein